MLKLNVANPRKLSNPAIAVNKKISRVGVEIFVLVILVQEIELFAA